MLFILINSINNTALFQASGKYYNNCVKSLQVDEKYGKYCRWNHQIWFTVKIE
jgi:hypothetical protein